MKLRIAALALTLVALPVFAQKYKNQASAGTAERAAMLKTLERGKPLKGSRDAYEHLPQVFAVALASSSETPEQAMARIGESGAQLVETKGRLVLFRSARSKAALVQYPGGAGVFPTAVNARTGALGVLTGTLIVKPKELADGDAIGASHGLETIKAYPQLHTVFYRAKAKVDIADVSAALQADPRVESAYPEIIENVRAPK
jgi:fervidolysin-like protein